MDKNSKVFVAGGSGMVGSAIIRALLKTGYTNIIGSYHTTRPESFFRKPYNTQPLSVKLQSINLLDQQAVLAFMREQHPDCVVLAAAKVGGIMANYSYPAEFIYENLVIETNIIHSAHLAHVQNLLFLGSSCIYPKQVQQPIKEEALLTGLLEPTNEPYAIAKIAGIKLCESYNRQHGRDYRSIMPSNLYGPGDNFHPENSHVIPALLRRFHEAVHKGYEEVVIWGSGKPRREFLHVDDLAEACLHVINLSDKEYKTCTQPMLSHINAGTGIDFTIKELAKTIARITGFEGRLCFDTNKPDGTPRKLLDVSKLAALGWRARIGLEDGIRDAYRWFLENES